MRIETSVRVPKFAINKNTISMLLESLADRAVNEICERVGEKSLDANGQRIDDNHPAWVQKKMDMGASPFPLVQHGKLTTPSQWVKIKSENRVDLKPNQENQQKWENIYAIANATGRENWLTAFSIGDSEIEHLDDELDVFLDNNKIIDIIN